MPPAVRRHRKRSACRPCRARRLTGRPIPDNYVREPVPTSVEELRVNLRTAPHPATVTGAIVIAGFGFSAAINWPGHLSYDSVIQLLEGRTGVYANWHPPGRRLWPSGSACCKPVIGPATAAAAAPPPSRRHRDGLGSATIAISMRWIWRPLSAPSTWRWTLRLPLVYGETRVPVAQQDRARDS